MQFDAALEYLLGLGHETLAMKLGLTNTERLLESLGNPQSSYPSVQIAGTNGKGSTAVMLEAILRVAGIKAGLYTSPHLKSITERIRINNQLITEDDFARLATQVRQASERLLSEGKLATLPTFFEQVTAIALNGFAQAPVQLAILETGLGGRLDATTTARAETICITPIALDHQEYLGRTLREIAAEKAAIIHPGVTAAIIAPQAGEAMDVILDRCMASGVKPRVTSDQVDVRGATDLGRMTVSFRTKEDRYENVSLGLRGRHQITNAASAIALAEALRASGFSIRREAIIEGLENARHAGRLELLQSSAGLMLFDGAHNVAGAQALRAFLDEFIETPITLVFGAMRDKELKEIAATLFRVAQYLVLTQPANARSATLEQLARLAPPDLDSSRITLAPSAQEAMQRARAQTPADGIICVTGSLYLIGEIQAIVSDGK
jgi:dihydrofolate synthase/folylpolyglutamate synthase